MVTLKSENRVFDTLTSSCDNSCLLNVVHRIWDGRFVMCLYSDKKLAIFWIDLATLKSQNMVFANLSLCGVNSCVSKCIKVCMKIVVLHMGHVTLWWP